MSLVLLPLVSTLMIGAPTAEQPWYERPSCRAALDDVMSAQLDDAERRLKALASSSDIEDQACAVWARTSMAETQIAVGGRIPALLENRERRLLQLFKFARAHRQYSHLADLGIEARVRRIRVLVDKGEQKAALSECQNIEKMLASRKGVSNPTLDYVRGVVNMAVSQSGWGLRMLLRMAGTSGDAEAGRKALVRLAAGDTVYAPDAQYLRHFFSVENPSPENGSPAELMKPLVARYPTNPQFLYDIAVDLRAAKKCGDAMAAVQPARAELERDPTMWSNQVRAKVYWISGRCAADLGNRVDAKRYVALAAAQKFAPLEEEIRTLSGQL